MRKSRGLAVGAVLGSVALWVAMPVRGADPVPPAERTWMNPQLTPDERATLLERAMTPAEKRGLINGRVGTAFRGKPLPPGALGSAGFVAGIERLGVPALQETDAGLGIANPGNARPGDRSTAMPATLALAATWSPELAYRSGVVLGDEARRKGFNVVLAGGMNLARDPRNGRNFEYFGEDPLLAGTMAGEAVRGIQSRHVISTLKHFALNAQETGRFVLDARIDEAALRESDLLSFELAIERAHPGAIMCAYNKVNGDYACGNDFLLNHVLKGDWGFPGWVMSDWGAVHDVTYAARGLDQESGEPIDPEIFFEAPLDAAMAAGEVTQARISDMVRRILRSMFAAGLFDESSIDRSIDFTAHAAEVRRVAEQSIVVLRNENDALPLSRNVRRVAVIGGFADQGVISGGGSSQVHGAGGALPTVPVNDGRGRTRQMVLHPSSPLAAIRSMVPRADVEFVDGRDPAEAAAAASRADVAIVFATQWMTEGADAPDLSLPSEQDALIDAVAAANPHTVVVLETGGAVLMPWLDATGAVVAAWYAGERGGEAIANVLFGAVEPGGRLPVTFPVSEGQLPRTAIPGWSSSANEPFVVDYPEGADVGYRWFARRGMRPRFPFGYGLSYTTFGYSGLKISGSRDLVVSFEVRNTGKRAGYAVAQIYLTRRAGRPERRLVAWGKLLLQPGEQKQFSARVDPRLLADFDTSASEWQIAAGDYDFSLGDSAEHFTQTASQILPATTLPP